MDHNKEWDQEKNDRILSDEREMVLSAFFIQYTLLHSHCCHGRNMANLRHNRTGKVWSYFFQDSPTTGSGRLG